MRKLLVCMDGTGNEIGDGETNVLKLYRALAQDDEQLTHYIMGVGTNDSPSTRFVPIQKISGVLGLAFGRGLEDDVLRAYRWLCKTYKSDKDYLREWRRANPRKRPASKFRSDQIYIMGFSRGSYSARVLAGFINAFGLVNENNLHLVTPAFRAYRKVNYRDEVDEAGSMRFKALRQFTMALRPQITPIRALLLFDTVASIIRLDWPWHAIPRYWSLFDLGLHAYVQENPSVRIVIHAQAIDERRTFFRNLPWLRDKPYFGNRFEREAQQKKQYVRQRWFAGYHSDIGGGVQEDEAGISKITALWLLNALVEEEKRADEEDLELINKKRLENEKEPIKRLDRLEPGLRFRRFNKKLYFLGVKAGTGLIKNPGGFTYSRPDPLAKTHNSVWGDEGPWSWFWAILEFLPPKATLRRAAGKPALFRRFWPYYLPLFEPRHIPPEDEVDDSVYIRRTQTAYNPSNLERDTPNKVTPWWEAEYH